MDRYVDIERHVSTGEGRCGLAGMRVLSIPEHRFPILSVAISIASGIGNGGVGTDSVVHHAACGVAAGSVLFETAHDIVSYSKGVSMRLFRIVVTLFAVVITLAAVAGCEKEGPAEKAGKQIDQAVQQAGDQAGKAADAVGDKLNEAGDKIKDSSK